MSKSLTDPARYLVALNVASYVRWVETRRKLTPRSEWVQSAVRGWLDGEGYSYDADEPKAIELLVWALNVDVVEDFIQKTSIFDRFDKY